MTKLSKFAAIALVCVGVLLALMAWRSDSNEGSFEAVDKMAVPGKSLVQVVVAQRNLPAGHVIAAEDLRLQGVEQLPAQALTQIEQVVGKTTAVEVAQDMALSSSSFLEGLASLLQTGERAVSIKVEEFSAVGHKLRPGDWVDVFAVLRRDTHEIEDTQARLLLHRKRVLAYGAQLHPAAESSASPSSETEGQRKSAPPPPARTAVIAVQVEEVNPLVLADQQGQLLLALRSPLDEVGPATGKPEAETLKTALVEAQAQPERVGMAMERSVAGLTLKELTEVSAGKPRMAAPPLARPTPSQKRTTSAKPVRTSASTAVEVVRGTRTETVRY